MIIFQGKDLKEKCLSYPIESKSLIKRILVFPSQTADLSCMPHTSSVRQFVGFFTTIVTGEFPDLNSAEKFETNER